MAMAHLKINNEVNFEFEKKDELLVFTVTKDFDGLSDEAGFGLTIGVVEKVNDEGVIEKISIIPHSVKHKVFSSKKEHVDIPVNELRVEFYEWFNCASSNLKGQILPLYKINDSPLFILIKEVFRPFGKK